MALSLSLGPTRLISSEQQLLMGEKEQFYLVILHGHTNFNESPHELAQIMWQRHN